jgi:hypothetical protein
MTRPDFLCFSGHDEAIRAPKANAYCERLIGSLRRECLDWFILLNERHVRNAGLRMGSSLQSGTATKFNGVMRRTGERKLARS